MLVLHFTSLSVILMSVLTDLISFSVVRTFFLVALSPFSAVFTLFSYFSQRFRSLLTLVLSVYTSLSGNLTLFSVFFTSLCPRLTCVIPLLSPRHDVIPIAMGAHPDDYRRASPPHSFIHVDDFESPQRLAEYLHKLDQDDHLYNQYFQ